MILWEECNVGARLLWQAAKPSGDKCTPWENTNQEPPTDVTDVHRLGGYGIPAIPTLPTKLSSHRSHRSLRSLTICGHL